MLLSRCETLLSRCEMSKVVLCVCVCVGGVCLLLSAACGFPLHTHTHTHILIQRSRAHCGQACIVVRFSVGSCHLNQIVVSYCALQCAIMCVTAHLPLFRIFFFNFLFFSLDKATLGSWMLKQDGQVQMTSPANDGTAGRDI